MSHELERLRRRCEELETLANKQDAEIERLKGGLCAVNSLINNSQGIYGLHLNGEPAPWGELRTGGAFEEWLKEFDDALGLNEQRSGRDESVRSLRQDAADRRRQLLPV